MVEGAWVRVIEGPNEGKIGQVVQKGDMNKYLWVRYHGDEQSYLIAKKQVRRIKRKEVVKEVLKGQ
jgi:hypothetical protein